MTTGFKLKQKGTDGLITTTNALSGSTWGTTYVRSAIYAGGQYVAVGNGGFVATSPDGVTWTVRPQLRTTGWGTSRNPVKIIYNNGQYFIASDDGSPYAAISTDAITWQSGYIGNWGGGNGIATFAYGNGQYCLIGGHNVKYATSNTGIPSSFLYSGSAGDLGVLNAWNIYDMEWNGSKFLVVGNYGVTWSSNTGNINTYTTYFNNLSGANQYWLNNNVNKVKYLNGNFIAVGGTGRYATSSDGVTWTYRFAAVNAIATTTPWAGQITDVTSDGTNIISVGNSFVISTANNVTFTGKRANDNAGYRNDYAVLYGNGYYMFHGSNRVAITADFTNWTYNSTGTYMYGCVYAFSKHIFVGTSGYQTYSSDNGSTWTTSQVSAFGGQTMYGLAYDGSSKIVVGGTNGRIATSTDGTTWTYQQGLSNTSWSTTQVNGIAWDGSKYIACGNSGKLATSTDGVTWTYNSSLISTAWSSNNISSIAFGNSKYVVGGPSMVAYSSDLTNWTVLTNSFSGLDSAFGIYACRDLIWNSTNSEWLVVGDGGRCATSNNGVDWNYRKGFNDVWGSTGATSAIWDGSKYVVLGGSGKVATSANGVTWTLQTSLANTTWSTGTGTALATNNTTTVAFGSAGQVAYSTDGANWTYNSGLINSGWVSGSNINCCNYNGSQYMVFGDLGNVGMSKDGLNWTQINTLKSTTWGSNSVYCCIWTGSQYVIGGGGGKIATSPDGNTWTVQTSLASTTFGTGTVYKIHWNGFQFMVNGVDGKIATSPDAVTWTYKSALTTFQYVWRGYGIAYSGGVYVTTGGNWLGNGSGGSYIFRSTNNGTTWTVITPPGADGNPLTVCALLNGRFYVGGASALYTSTDGLTWTQVSSFSTCSNLEFNGQEFLATTTGGAILTSSDGITWTNRGTAYGGGVAWNPNVSKWLLGGTSGGIALFNDDYLVDLDDLLVRRDAFSAGNLYAWGRGDSGQIGDGTQSPRSSPVTVAGGGSSWKYVDCAAGNDCREVAAIKTDGTLWNWGKGGYGQLGNNTTGESWSPVTTAGGGTNWKHVACGYYFKVAVKTDGSVWSWGLNNTGQLGDGTTSSRLSPVSVLTSGSYKSVYATGSYYPTYQLHASGHALKTDGSLWSWGDNSQGQLGDGTTTNRSSPVSVIGGITDWKQISCGYNVVIGLRTNGTLWYWGISGLSSPTSYAAAGSGWKTIDAGGGNGVNFVGIKTDGTLWTWGKNYYGELGTGDTNAYNSPVTTVGGGKDWKQAACGYTHMGAVKTDGTIWTWGRNNGGQLGDGTTTNRLSPVKASGSNWKQISCGYSRTQGITDLSL